MQSDLLPCPTGELPPEVRDLIPFDLGAVRELLAAASRSDALWFRPPDGGRRRPSRAGVVDLRRQLDPHGCRAVEAGYHRVSATFRGVEGPGWVCKTPLCDDYLRANSSEVERWATASAEERRHLVPVWDVGAGVALSLRVRPLTAAEGRRHEREITWLASALNVPDAGWRNVGWLDGRLAFFDYGYVVGGHWPVRCWPGQAPPDVLAFWAARPDCTAQRA
jgi:hypothetical protein